VVTASPAFHNAPATVLAGELVRAAGLAQVHFANSGAEANEAALKLARQWGRLYRGGYESSPLRMAFTAAHVGADAGVEAGLGSAVSAGNAGFRQGAVRRFGAVAARIDPRPSRSWSNPSRASRRGGSARRLPA